MRYHTISFKYTYYKCLKITTSNNSDTNIGLHVHVCIEWSKKTFLHKQSNFLQIDNLCKSKDLINNTANTSRYICTCHTTVCKLEDVV